LPSLPHLPIGLRDEQDLTGIDRTADRTPHAPSKLGVIHLRIELREIERHAPGAWQQAVIVRLGDWENEHCFLFICSPSPLTSGLTIKKSESYKFLTKPESVVSCTSTVYYSTQELKASGSSDD
jgi:hypothetical protein